ncbi:hypothetical protein QU38_02525, partial [Staphylococcus aureus]
EGDCFDAERAFLGTFGQALGARPANRRRIAKAPTGPDGPGFPEEAETSYQGRNGALAAPRKGVWPKPHPDCACSPKPGSRTIGADECPTPEASAPREDRLHESRRLRAAANRLASEQRIDRRVECNADAAIGRPGDAAADPAHAAHFHFHRRAALDRLGIFGHQPALRKIAHPHLLVRPARHAELRGQHQA